MIRAYRRYRVRRRWLVILAMLACVAFHTVVVGHVFLSPEQFRVRAQLLLQRQFRGEVRLGEAGYRFPGIFRLGGISVSRPPEQGGGEMFRAKSLRVDVALLSLLRGKVAVSELMLEEPELFLTKADFAKGTGPRSEMPKAQLERVIVRGGRIHLAKGMFFDGSPEQELTDVNMELREERRFARGYGFAGEANSALWGRCNLDGTLDLGAQRLDIAVAARGIAIDQRLREAFPKEHGKTFELLNPEGVVDLTLESSISWAGDGKITHRAIADLRDCSAAWSKFPLKCTEIRGKVVLDWPNVYYENLSGRAGPATVTLSGQTTAEKVDLHIIGRGRPLNREVYEAAPEPLKKVWDRFVIEGAKINVDSRSTYWRKEKEFEIASRVEVREGRATYKLFPYPLAEITGSIRWDQEKGKKEGASYVEGIRGRRGNARVHISGQITDKGVPDLVVEAFDLPFDQALRDALRPEWQKIFEALHPEGTAYVHCRVTSKTSGVFSSEEKTPDVLPKNLQYRFLIRPEGGSFRYKDFPHTITDVRGDILVDEAGTASFRDLTGKLGNIPLKILGSVRVGAKERTSGVFSSEEKTPDVLPVPDITVVASEVEFGPAARAILAKDWAALYDDLDPRGKVSFTWRLSSDPATGAPRQSTRVECLQDCSVQHKLFPVRITSLIGHADVDGTGRTTFTGVKGRVGNAAVEVIVGHCPPGDKSGLCLTVRFGGLLLNEEIRKAIPPLWQTVWDELRPSGEANVEYHLSPNAKDPEHPNQRITLEPSDCAFCYTKLPLPVSDITRGKVVFDQDGATTISQLQGKVRGKTVELNGKVTATPKGHVLRLDVAADELALDDELRRTLPEEWQENWGKLQLSGKIAVSASVVVNLKAADWESFVLNATLKGCEATWRHLPIRLTGLRGRAEYSDGTVTLSDVVGGCAVAEEVRVSGRYSTKGGSGDRLQVAIQNARLEGDLLAAFPADVRKALEGMALRGAADIKLTFTTPPEAGGARPLPAIGSPSPAIGSPSPAMGARCFGEILLRDCAFRHSRAFEGVNGNVRIDNGLLAADGSQTFEGGLDLRRLQVDKLVVTEVKGEFAYSRGAPAKDQPPQSRLAFSNLVGSFYGGSASAKGGLDLGKPGQFSGWLSLRGVDFKVFSKEALGMTSDATGTLDVRLEFPPGRYKDDKDLIGDGTASVTRGELGQLPLTASLFNALELRSPLDRSITEASMKFGIAKDHLAVKELSLLGESRLMTGQGTVGFDRTLDLKVVSPRSGIPVLSLIQSFIREQVVQTVVRGTISEPEARVIVAPVIPELLDQINNVLGLWRKRQPKPPEPPPSAPAPAP